MIINIIIIYFFIVGLPNIIFKLVAIIQFVAHIAII